MSRVPSQEASRRQRPLPASFPSIALLAVVLFALGMTIAPILRADPPERKPFVLYAQFNESTPVELSTGAKWRMDKGDCFPIYMFKERRTKVILQLGSATFSTDAIHVRVMKDGETAAALASYQKNLDSFTKIQADETKGGAPSAEPAAK